MLTMTSIVAYDDSYAAIFTKLVVYFFGFPVENMPKAQNVHK
jgi:hypothetical protein